MVLTLGGFRNSKHSDNDESGYSLGVWGLVKSTYGQLISSEERRYLIEQKNKGYFCEALGAKFHIGNVVVDLDSADVVMMTFNSKVDHYTSHPTNTGGSLGSDVTRSATSHQISRSVAIALRELCNVGDDFSVEEWLDARKNYGRSYEEMVEDKINKLS